MLRLGKQKFSVTDGDPIFEARYLGSRETDRPYGWGCATGATAKLWSKSAHQKSLPKAFIQVGLSGVRLSLVEKSGMPNIVNFNIKDISYCSVETDIHERIFAWIHREEIIKSSEEPQASVKSPKSETIDSKDLNLNDSTPSVSENGSSEIDVQSFLAEVEDDDVTRRYLRGAEDGKSFRFQCYAVLATKSNLAQAMASTLRRAFHIAYKNWKLSKTRTDRERFVKSLTEKDFETLRRCKADSGVGDCEDNSSLASSNHLVSRCSSDAESVTSSASAPK